MNFLNCCRKPAKAKNGRSKKIPRFLSVFSRLKDRRRGVETNANMTCDNLIDDPADLTNTIHDHRGAEEILVETAKESILLEEVKNIDRIRTNYAVQYKSDSRDKENRRGNPIPTIQDGGLSGEHPINLPNSNIDRDLKIIDFSIVNQKSLTSKFATNENALLDNDSNIQSALWLEVSFDLGNNIKMYNLLQPDDEYVAFNLLARPTSEFSALRDLSMEIDSLIPCFEVKKREKCNIPAAQVASTSTALNHRDEISPSSVTNMISAIPQQGTSRNAGKELVRSSKLEVKKKATQKIYPHIHATDHFECESFEEVSGGGVVINGEVYIAKRQIHSIASTEQAGILCCEVCDEEFSKQTLRMHYALESHIKNVNSLAPLRVFGISFVRKIAPQLYHCAVCNTSYAQPWRHFESAEHAANLQQAKKAVADHQTRHRIHSNIPSTANTSKFLKVTILKVLTGGYIINEMVAITVRRFNASLGTNAQPYCGVCRQSLRGVNPVPHYQDAEHKANLKRYSFLAEHGMGLIRQLPTKEYHCGVCGVTCPDAPAHTQTVCSEIVAIGCQLWSCSELSVVEL